MNKPIDQRAWFLKALDALSQFANVWLLRGEPNECISGRQWREQRLWAVKFIDALFFWDKDHCQGAWKKDNRWAALRLRNLGQQR